MTTDAQSMHHLLRQRPFQAFTLRLNDDRSFEVWEPESVLFPSTWTESLLVALPGERYERVRLADVKGIDLSLTEGKVLLALNGAAIIIDRGRGPEIKGTRITVYDVLDYHKHAHPPSTIAFFLRVRQEQVEAAIRYIEENKDEVMRRYQRMLDRDAAGNPPHIRALAEESHRRLEEFMRARREARANATGGEALRAGDSGGR